MKKSQFKYAVNTNGLKNMDIKGIVNLCRKAGVDGIEWGLKDLKSADRDAAIMSRMTKDAGLEVLGYINAGHLWKTDEITQWSEAVCRAGGKTLRVAHPWFGYNYEETLHQRDSFTTLFKHAQEGLERLMPLGKEYGLRYVLEMHSGSVAASAPCARQIMEGLDSRYAGIIYDPANTVLEGFLRPRASVEILGDYLAYVHAKNLFYRQSGGYLEGPVKRLAWEYSLSPLDCGIVDYLEIFFALKCGGFNGWISMEEFFSGKKDPLHEIVQALRFLKECAETAPLKPAAPFIKFND